MKRDIFIYFRKFARYGADYRALKENEEKRGVSGLFGRRAFYNTIGTALLLVAALGLAALGFAGLDSEGFFFTILGVIAFAAAGVALILAFVYEILSLICAVRQIRLNKRAIGKTALIVNLVLVITVVVGAVIILSQIAR